MERLMKCRYCGKEFTAMRLDKKTCSGSCRTMYTKRRNDPHTYGKVVPVLFDLDEDEYRSLLKWADSENKHPYDLAKDLVVNGQKGLIKVLFTPKDMSWYLNKLDLVFEDASLEKLIHDWTMERAKMELEKWENE